MNEFSPIDTGAAISLSDLIDHNPGNGPQKTGARRFWTNRELGIVRHYYDTDGLVACLQFLPGRTSKAVYQKARELGLVRLSPSGQPRAKRQQWVSSPEIDAEIRRVYTAAPDHDAIKSLARRLGRPLRWVRARAGVLGCALPKLRPSRWSEAELDVLRARVGQHPGTVRQALKAIGSKRSITAIMLQRKRLGLLRDPAETDDGVVALAECFGVSRDAVHGWVKRGWLKAGRRGPQWSGGRPGDGSAFHFSEKDVREFVVGHVAHIDFRKVDKFWLVELLAPAGGS